MKKCPYCAEEIQDKAAVCRHCGKSLPTSTPNQSVSTGGGKNWLLFFKILGILIAIIFTIVWWYVTIPAFAIWAIWKKSKLDQQKKIIATIIIVAIFAIAFGAMAYYTRTPHLTITDPKSEVSVQAKDYTVKGEVSPAYSTVTVNSQPVTVDSKGDFTSKVVLPNETNSVTVSATNSGDKVDASVTIKRIFTDEEKSAQAQAAKDRADKAAKAKADVEAKKKADDAKVAADQAAYDKSPAGRLCKAHADWTKDDCQKIADKKYWIGMTLDMLVALRGKPNTTNPSSNGFGTEYQYCWDYYTPSCFYDNNGDGALDAFN